MSDVLTTHNLSKRYRKHVALSQLSFAVPEGSVYGLLGANGAGKTTALKLLMNLHEPTSGEAQVLGVDSRRLQGRHFQQIGYVSENQDQPGWMTMKYLLNYLKPFYPTWDDERAAELVAQFRLPLDRPIKHFSRGMQMKASLASSLAYHPKLLVLDEPFSGLDPLTREELIEALLESEPESSIVVSSHDLADIESFASHIGYLDKGKLEFSEELSSLTARFREMEVTLQEPALPAPWPSHWLRPEASPAVVRFVETHFDPDRTIGEIRLLFRGVTNIEANPMPLRSIFVTLARASQVAA
ncbi:MAG: ABC transporter ATP-binding protein [Acidobacteriota bacterium]